MATVLSVLLCSAARAAPAPDGDRAHEAEAAQITNLLLDYLAHVEDKAANERFWAEDVIYTGSAGQRSGKNDILESLAAAKTAAPAGQTIRHRAEDIRVQQYGNVAVVAFRLRAEITQGPHVTVKRHLTTAVFVKRDLVWRVVAWQSTSEPSD